MPLPEAQRCRDFLNAMLESKLKYKLVLTPELLAEWQRHQLGFASAWLTRMFAQKRVVGLTPVVDGHLRSRIARCLTEPEVAAAAKRAFQLTAPAMIAALEKDYHLLEAALGADHTVISLDEVIRRLFARAAADVQECQQVAWVNPAKAEEHAVDWLAEGAELRNERLLANLPYGLEADPKGSQ